MSQRGKMSLLSFYFEWFLIVGVCALHLQPANWNKPKTSLKTGSVGFYISLLKIEFPLLQSQFFILVSLMKFTSESERSDSLYSRCKEYVSLGVVVILQIITLVTEVTISHREKQRLSRGHYISSSPDYLCSRLKDPIPIPQQLCRSSRSILLGTVRGS